MFDIGFFEILLIGIMGLLVLGPERLPQAAATVGLWVGRLRRKYLALRSDIERELGADEIRRQLHNEAIMEELEKNRTLIEEEVSILNQDVEPNDKTNEPPKQ